MKSSLMSLRVWTPIILASLSMSFASAQTVWTGAGADKNWSTVGNWNGPVPPGAADNVKFYDDGADATPGMVNNIVNALFSGSVLSLQYAQSNLMYHTTQIDAGKTLTILGNLVVGTEAIAAQNVDAAMAGPGTLVVSNTAAEFIVRQGGDGSSRRATLDLAGLDTLIVNVDRVLIGRADPTDYPNINRNTGWLYLARTNRILANAANTSLNVVGVEVGRSGSNNGNGSRLYLGQTNALFATSLGVGMEKETGCQMLFNPNFTDPVLFIRGVNGTSRIGLWTIGDGEANSGTTSCQGTCDFTGGSLDAMVDRMTIGRASANAGGTGNSRGTLTLSAGTLDVNTLQVGLQTLSSGKNGSGTVNVNGGMLVVNDTLELGVAAGGAGVATTIGTLNINAGTLMAGAIVTGPISGGSTINLNGTLVVTNTAGTTTASLGDLTMSDATLHLAVLTQEPRVVVTNLTTGGVGNTIRVGAIPSITVYPAQFALIDYQFGIGGSGYNFTLAGLGGAYAGYLSNNVDNSSVDLVITSGPVAQPVTWVGNLSGNWDTSTYNWKVGSTSTNFFDGDYATFDDTASGNTTVNLTAPRSPGSMTVNNSSKAYAFTGSGIGGVGGLTKNGSGTLLFNNTGANSFSGNMVINAGTVQVGNGGTSGSLGGGLVSNNGSLVFNRGDAFTVPNDIGGSAVGTLIKQGSGTLLLSGANTFAGAVTIADGTLKAGGNSALGDTNGTTTIANGATLDVGANNINLGLENISVSGSGVGGNGAIINSSGSGAFVGPNVALVTMTGDTTFGGTGRWDLRSSNTGNPAGAALSTGGQPYKLTKVGLNGVYLPGVTVDPALGDVDVQQGTLAIESGTTGIGNPAYTLTVRAGATLQLYNMTNLLNKNLVLVGAGTNNTINNASGVNTVIGPMSLSGDCVFSAGGTSLILSNVMSGNGSLVKVGGATLILAGGPNPYTGNITVSNGTFVVDAINNGGGTLTLVTNTTLAGTGTYTGPVVVAGALQPGRAGQAGTLNCGPLSLESTATLLFDLSATTTVGGGVNDLVQVQGNLTAAGNSISINLLEGNLQPGTYRLMTYSGTLSGTFNPTVAVAGGASRLTLALSTTTPGQINLIVSGSTARLRWDSVISGTWDVGTSLNWLNLGSSVADRFYQGDAVLFDDTPGVVTGIDIPAGVSVVPSTITNLSDANQFTISGLGKISGGAGIVKRGSSTLTLGSANDFAGDVTVEAGTLLVTHNTALGNTTGETIIKSGATLDVGSPSAAANAMNLGVEPIRVSGTGVAAGGAIVNSSSTAQQNVVRVVTLEGHTTFGGSGRWDVRGTGAHLSTGGNAYNLTKIGLNQVSLVGAEVDPALADINVEAGIFSLETTTTSAGNPARTLTVQPGATLQLYQLATPLNKVIVLNGDGSSTTFNNNNGVNTVQGPVTLNGSCLFNVGGTSLTLSGSLGGTGSLTKNGNSLMSLSAANTYQGETRVNGGRIALTGAGAILNSPILTLATSTTGFDVTGRADGKLTLASGQTLIGHGQVIGSLQVNAGATVSPGIDVEATPISRIEATQNVMLAGTNVMHTDRYSLTNDVIAAASIAFGGTLIISDVNLVAYVSGDSFRLFEAGSYSGAFSKIDPAQPAAGLFWDMSELTTSGTIKVVSTAPPPYITSIVPMGNSVVISGMGGTPGGGYHVLTSANVSLPVASWTVGPAYTFGADGSFSFSSPLNLGTTQIFYRIQSP